MRLPPEAERVDHTSVTTSAARGRTLSPASLLVSAGVHDKSSKILFPLFPHGVSDIFAKFVNAKNILCGIISGFGKIYRLYWISTIFMEEKSVKMMIDWKICDFCVETAIESNLPGRCVDLKL